MKFNRFDGNVEKGGNGFGGTAFRNQLQDFPLTRGELFKRWRLPS
jgi:hypothetical protein